MAVSTLQFRLYPDAEHLEGLHTHLAHTRLIWNECRAARDLPKGAVTERLEFASRHNLGEERGTEEKPRKHKWEHDLAAARQFVPWLKEGSSTVQQQAIRSFSKAISSYYDQRKTNPKVGLPGFRKRFAPEHSFMVANPWEWREKEGSTRWGEVLIPKIGWVKFRLKKGNNGMPRLPEGAKTYVVKVDAVGKWWINFPIEAPDVDPRYNHNPTGKSTGTDPGVATTHTNSSGKKSNIPTLSPGKKARYLRKERKAARQIRVAQRTAVENGLPAKQWVRSNNYVQTRHELAVMRQILGDRCQAWLEETTTDLVRAYDLIGYENTNIRNMTRSAKGTVENPGTNVRAKSGLTRAILRQNWGRTKQRTCQKAERSGGSTTVVPTPAAYSSLKCSECKHIGLRQQQAVFVCKNSLCGWMGIERDADINAALNHEDEARRIVGADLREPLKYTQPTGSGGSPTGSCDPGKSVARALAKVGTDLIAAGSR